MTEIFFIGLSYKNDEFDWPFDLVIVTRKYSQTGEFRVFQNTILVIVFVNFSTLRQYYVYKILHWFDEFLEIKTKE